MRYSHQRERIFRAVSERCDHPTANMVYEQLKLEMPRLSLGTVYRNLNQLADDGSLLRLPFPVERFDANTAPHPHFRCRKCGRVYDLEVLGYDPSLDKIVEKKSGHRIERHELLFTGVCLGCTEKQ